MKLLTLTPADHETIRARIAAGDSARAIGATFGINRNTLYRLVTRENLGTWKSRGGDENARNSQLKRAIPDDFAIMAATMSNPQLVKYYACGVMVPARWRKELGIATPPRLKTGPKPKAKPESKAKPDTLVRNAYQTTPVDRTVKDGSRAGQAAEALRRFAPVYRCGPLGAADVKGTHWRYGRVVLTDAELVERAESKGWSADAWRKVA